MFIQLGPARLAVALAVLSAAGLLLGTAPVDGNFWWSDAPRHALNGAFVRDLVTAWPEDPRRWAVDYYLKYPALTVLFYPPLFYLVEAAVYGVMGVSHLAAQSTVALFTVVLLAATYGLARRILPRWSAVGAMLLVVGAPEVALWARQVMLDVPAYAMVVAAAFFLVRHVEHGRTGDLAATACCALAAVWIKLTAVFILPVFAVVLVGTRGMSALRARPVLLVAAVGVAGLLPLAWLTMRFGTANLESVAGRPSDLARGSLDAWLFYARVMPRSLGVPALVAAIVGVVGLLVPSRRDPPARWFLVFLGLWFVVGYAFFSMIGVREPRHGLMMLLPLGILAAAACHWVLPARLAQAGALVLGLGVFGTSLVWRPAPHVDGYREVANYVALHAPANAVVIFHGVRDGNFIYNMRTHTERPDITILRSDKLLLQVVAGERIRGVRETDLSNAESEAMLREFGVNLVVIQPGFWADLEPMARFERAVSTAAFTREAEFAITGSAPHSDRRVEIRRPTYSVAPTRRAVTIQMPMVGGVFSGEIGGHSR
jgi:Dolichyl-phosphate-mannose-protein mannosyltransferase